MPLYQMVHDGKFRQDLLYRINTVEIPLPSLKDRKEDIPSLVEHFLKIYCKKYKMPLKRINDATLKRLEKHNWPGNIRELQHAIERAVIMSDSKILQPYDFLLTKPDTLAEDDSFDTYNLDEVEHNVIRKVLKKHNGNISRAAQELGLTRASLYRRLEKYDL